MPEGNCPRCGSDKIIPDLPLPDHYGDVGGFARDAQVEVHGAPRAWIFTNTAAGKLTLRVCGNCGHAELFVGNFRELYERYFKRVSLRLGPPVPPSRLPSGRAG